MSVLTTGPSVAQTRVRTGEHGGFTRLVVDFTNRPSWRIGKTDAGYELRTESDTVFDLSDAFRRIDTARLAGLRDLGDGDLALEIACTCRLEVMELSNQRLVIDIVDGAPTPDDPYEIAIDRHEARPRAAPRPRQVKLPTVLPPAPATVTFGPLQDAEPAPRNVEDIARKKEVRRALLEQIAHGMSQGLVTARNPIPEQATPNDGKPESAAAQVPPPPSGPNIRIETQIDRDQRLGGGQSPHQPEFACLPRSELDVGAWFQPDVLLEGPGEARLALYDPRDRPDKGAHRELARRMLYMTFGAEARVYLQDGATADADTALLSDLARLMDGEAVAEGSILRNQIGCDSPGALWGLLAREVPPFGQSVDVEAAVATLSGWPPHLRRHLGPGLAAALLALGERDAALSVRNAITRGAEAPPAEATLVEAELSLDSGDLAAAESALAEVAASRSDEAADAMIKLLRARLDAGAPVPDGFVTSAEAMAFEIRNSPRAADLWTAVIDSQIRNTEIETALATLADATRRDILAPAERARLRDEALARLAETAGDVDFLRVILPELDAAPLNPPARLDVAERLADLRMAAPARLALGNRLDVPRPRERILLARIALLEDKPRIAESYLTGLSDPESRALLARAQALPDTPPSIAPDPEPAATPAAPSTSPGVLAENRLLLEESRARRAALDALLAPPE